MIPILYDSNETFFANNGIGRLRDCISCTVTEERNGIFECDFEYPVNGANFDKIQCGCIVGVIHDDTKTLQPFDIVSYSKPINGIVTFHAVHISYRLSSLTVSGTEINTLADALALLGTATPSSAFTYSADFTSNAYMAAADGTPRSVRQMLGGIEGSILDTYGGEYEFDKYNVVLHRNRGSLKDFKIRYGVNMIDYNEDMNYADVFTSCIPYWIGDDGNGEQIVVKGQKVDSGLIPYNGREQCVPLDLSSRFETAPTAADLEAKALSLMVTGNVNLPKQSIKVDFIRLQDFDEYRQYANLLTCGLCDRIEVIFPDYSTSGTFKIVKTVYDVLNERYKNMELGTLSTTLAQALGVTESLSGVNAGGGGSVDAPYGVCSTGAGTVAKTVTVTPNIDELHAGVLIYVKFVNANTSTNPTLDVNETGAKRIYRYGTTAAGTAAYSSWNANSVCALLYDGSAWQMVGWQNTTYSSMTVAEYQAGTGTTARIITPARLKAAIQYWSSDVSPYTSNPAMDGTASAGSSALYARGDHVHPTDTSRQATLVSGTNIKTINGNSLLGSGDLELSSGQSAFHGTCSTAANNANKDVTSTPAFINSTGSLIAVTFTNANTVANQISLKIDSDSGSRPVYVNGAVTSSTNTLLWEAGETILFQCVLRGPQNTYEYLAKSGGDGGTITDVQVNGTSVVSNGIATIPKATGSQFGVIEIGSSPGTLAITSGTSTYNSALLTSGTVSSWVLPDATQSTKGAMTSADKTKLDSITMTNGKIDSSVLPAETDPTVPAWAKASTKPSYNAGEIGFSIQNSNYIDQAQDVGQALYMLDDSVGNAFAGLSFEADEIGLSSASFQQTIYENDTNVEEALLTTDHTISTLTATDVGALPKTGGQVTGDITLYVASGNSPAIIFQRGTLTDNFNDWKIYDKSGFLYFAQRGSGSSAFGDVGYINTSGVAYFHVPWSYIDSKPTFATVATSGSYNDLTNKPSNATHSTAGLMSAADKQKLDAIASITQDAQSGEITIGSGASQDGTTNEVTI